MSDARLQIIQDTLRRGSVDKLAEMYVKLREDKAAIEAEAKTKVNKITARIDMIATELLRRMNEDGVQSFKTPHGSPYISKQVQGGIVDGDAFRNFVLENGRTDMFQSRVSISAVQEWNAENPDTPVPGVDLHVVRQVRVRKT